MTLPEPPAQPAPLSLTLFGPMQVLVAGRPLPRLHSRKSLWLLALLALRPGRPVEREWLAGTLWPDAGQDLAFANLRPVLSDLRRALGSQADRLRSPSRHALRLDVADAEVDVLTFDAAVAGRSLPALERAVAIYRGPLLEGCAEEWVGQERGAREQDCLRALEMLADAALAAGDCPAAVGHYRRAVGLDPWREASRRGLMEALDRGGDRNAALQVYREFVGMLRDDPRAVPDEKTAALYARLRARARQAAAAEPAPAPEAAAPAVTGSLPHPLTDLVGREDERAEVAARLRRSRLVTLTGPGGIGKTRLAIAVGAEVVREYADGVWLVALDALADGAKVAGQIAGVLGVKEGAGRSPLEGLTEHLRKKRLLLVLDNCEHVLEASAQAAAHLLRECADVRILTTSREALRITGETAWAVPTLAVPDAERLPAGRATLVRVLAGYEGVQLFVERAQAVQKTFSLTGDNARTVAEVCARLGGLPLAIELAAARIKAMTVAQIAARLDDHLGLLTGGSRVALSRQQTLRATLDWSYELLSEPERLLLARLSVFAGGWDLEAAERVCVGESLEARQILDLLTSLVNKSLAAFEEREGEEGGRYRLLETVRQYAAERLAASGEAEALRKRHRDRFLAFAEEAESGLKGSEQGPWLRRLAAERDNLRAALDGCAADARAAESGLRLAGALFLFWHLHGHVSEGRKHLERALAREGAEGHTPARAKALTVAGNLAYTQGDAASSRALLEESLDIRRGLGDVKGAAEALNDLANSLHRQGDVASARRHYEESLSLHREAGEARGVATALGNLGGLAREQGDYASAQALIEESLSIHRQQGDVRSVAMILNNLGNVVRLQGDYTRARTLYEESLDIRRDLGDKPGLAWGLSSLGLLACAQGDFATAQALHEESLSLRREMGSKNSIAWSLNNLGLAAQGQGDLASARALYAEGLTIFRGIDDKQGSAWSLNHLGVVAQSQGDSAAAQALHEESLSIFQGLGDREGAAASLKELAAALASRGANQKAVRLWGAAQSLRESLGAQMPPVERERHDRQVAQARSALGEEAFAAAWEEGRALPWQQAAALALSLNRGVRPPRGAGAA